MLSGWNFLKKEVYLVWTLQSRKVAQWLGLLKDIKKVSGLEFAYSPCLCGSLLQVLCFPHTVQRYAGHANKKLLITHRCECEFEHMSLFWPVIDWWLGQVSAGIWTLTPMTNMPFKTMCICRYCYSDLFMPSRNQAHFLQTYRSHSFELGNCCPSFKTCRNRMHSRTYCKSLYFLPQGSK